MVSVRLAEEEYTVNEDERTVTVCVERIGQSADGIMVTVRSQESMPPSAEGEYGFFCTCADDFLVSSN